MKRFWIWLIALLALAGVGGGYWYSQQPWPVQTSDQYQTYLKNGQKAARQKHYAQASSAFRAAYRIKPTSYARTCKQQAQNLQAANRQGLAGNYDLAISASQKAQAESGYAVMRQEAQNLEKTLKDVQDNYENEIKPLFNQASDNEDQGNYEEAIDNYRQILKLPYINYKFYGKWKRQAQDKIQADKDQRQKTDRDQQDKGSQPKTKKGHVAGAMGNHQVNGKSVTNDQISQLRKRVGQLGYEPTSWSPQDLIDLYRQAASHGRNSISAITKKDVEDFLKP